MPYKDRKSQRAIESMRRCSAKYRAANRIAINQKQAAAKRLSGQHRKIRQAILEAGGRCCQRCGFSDYRALQLDHIHGDGWKDRSLTVTSKARDEAIRLIRQGKFSTKFQLLCANCNWIKRYEQAEHTRGITRLGAKIETLPLFEVMSCR